jgi:hypothetical protein
MASLQTRAGAPTYSAPPSAVVWLNGRRAVAARMSHDGRASTCEIERGFEPEDSYLAIIARTLGTRERLLILGPNRFRQALERDYVARYGRSSRLIDVEPSSGLGEQDLVARLRALAA